MTINDKQQTYRELIVYLIPVIHMQRMYKQRIWYSSEYISKLYIFRIFLNNINEHSNRF